MQKLLYIYKNITKEFNYNISYRKNNLQCPLMMLNCITDIAKGVQLWEVRYWMPYIRYNIYQSLFLGQKYCKKYSYNILSIRDNCYMFVFNCGIHFLMPSYVLDIQVFRSRKDHVLIQNNSDNLNNPHCFSHKI